MVNMIIECTKVEASWIVYALHHQALKEHERSKDGSPSYKEMAKDFENLSDRISMELYRYNPNNP